MNPSAKKESPGQLATEPPSEKTTEQNTNGMINPSTTEAIDASAVSSPETDQEELSEEDLANLRRISGKIPVEAWIVAWFSGAERFAYYALQAPLRRLHVSYSILPRLTFKRKLHSKPCQRVWSPRCIRHGAVGCYSSQLVSQAGQLHDACLCRRAGGWALGAIQNPRCLVWVSCTQHQWCYSSLISCRLYFSGILLLLLTSIPPALDAGAGLGGLIGAFILIGLGVGGVKSSVAPFTGNLPHDLLYQRIY